MIISNLKLVHSEMRGWDCSIKIMEDELGNISVKGYWGAELQFQFQSKIPETVFEALSVELVNLYTKTKAL